MCLTFSFQTAGINRKILPFPMKASTLLGRLSTMLDQDSRDFLPVRHKSISEVRHWCWVMCLGSQSAFQFIPKVFGELYIWALCGIVKILLEILVCMDLTLSTIFLPEQKRASFQTAATWLRSENINGTECYINTTNSQFGWISFGFSVMVYFFFQSTK